MRLVCVWLLHGRPGGIAGIIAACKRVEATDESRSNSCSHRFCHESQLCVTANSSSRASSPCCKTLPRAHHRRRTRFHTLGARQNSERSSGEPTTPRERTMHWKRSAVTPRDGPTAAADGVLAALESPELVERRISARRDLLAPTRSPDFEGVLLWECADAISKAAPALACDDHAGVLYALALSRAALSARGHGADARRLERAVAKHFHALPRETRGDVAYDLVAADDIRRSPRWDGDDRCRARAQTVLVAFAGLGSRGHVGYEWRGAAHRVSQDQDFDVLFAADPAASWYTGGACWRL